jgi:hypothetical protein
VPLKKISIFFPKRRVTEKRTFSCQIPTTGGSALNAGFLCISMTDPPCKHSEPASKTTCDDLAQKWNLSIQGFVNLNRDVNNQCTNLVLGQYVRNPALDKVYMQGVTQR